MRKPTVSIGIPAYNEESNIKELVLSLLKQKQDKFALKEIIIVSDGSNDGTVSKVKSIKNRKVALLQSKKRIGQAASQNKIIKLFSGEILILLNADILLENEVVLSKLIQPFLSDPKVGIVVPKILPLMPTNALEKILNFSVDLKIKLYESWNRGSNLYACIGRARAFPRSFAKQLLWPKLTAEDAYSYFKCITLGYKFVYRKDAVIRYKLPSRIADHIKQSARFMTGSEEMSRYFKKELVVNQYDFPLSLKLKTSLHYFMKNPVYFISYILVFTYVKFQPNKNRYMQIMWEPSYSSKNLATS